LFRPEDETAGVAFGIATPGGNGAWMKAATTTTILPRSCARLLQITHWLGSWVVAPGLGAVREAPVSDLASDSATPLGAEPCAAKSPEAECSAIV